MVTGDQLAIAVEASRRLGLGTNIMEGKALMAGNSINDQLATQVNQVRRTMVSAALESRAGGVVPWWVELLWCPKT